jgi:hypothetical protein
MKKEKEKELNEMVRRISKDFRAKFEKGAREHAGKSDDFEKLSPLELLYESLAEKYDDLAYTLKAIKLLEASLKTGKDSPLTPEERR